MAGCGYVCPKCEGTGLIPETLESCGWCAQELTKKVTITYEDWINTVHNSNCCSDIGHVDTSSSDKII